MRHAIEEPLRIECLQCPFDELKAGRAPQYGEIALFDLACVVVRKAIHAHNLRAAADERLGNVGTDEPGSAGDKRLHAKTSCTRAGRRHGRPSGVVAACLIRPTAAGSGLLPTITRY